MTSVGCSPICRRGHDYCQDMLLGPFHNDYVVVILIVHLRLGSKLLLHFIEVNYWVVKLSE